MSLLTVEDVRNAFRALDESGRNTGKYQRIWRTLIIHTGGILAVSCALCRQVHGECRCPQNGKRGNFTRWSYHIETKQPLLSQIENWRITTESLAQLTLEDIATRHPEFRDLVMRVVQELLLLDTATDQLTAAHFGRAFALETAGSYAKHSLWRTLIFLTGSCLEVTCTICQKSYNKRECRCPKNGRPVGEQWEYFVEWPNQPMARMHNWAVGREGLARLTTDDIRSETAETKAHLLRVVARMLESTLGANDSSGATD